MPGMNELTTILLYLYTVLGILFMIVTMILLDRNYKVANYRRDLIEKMYQASVNDIDAKTYIFAWRQEIYHSVSYNDMLFKFWKPLDSFYPDKSFLEPKSRHGQTH